MNSYPHLLPFIQQFASKKTKRFTHVWSHSNYIMNVNSIKGFFQLVAFWCACICWFLLIKNSIPITWNKTAAKKPRIMGRLHKKGQQRLLNLVHIFRPTFKYNDTNLLNMQTQTQIFYLHHWKNNERKRERNKINGEFIIIAIFVDMFMLIGF